MFDPVLFNSPAHRHAQAACRHLIHCAVDGPTRGAVVANLDHARRSGDPTVPILIAQLAGPCCLPPVTEETATARYGHRFPTTDHAGAVVTCLVCTGIWVYRPRGSAGRPGYHAAGAAHPTPCPGTRTAHTQTAPAPGCNCLACHPDRGPRRTGRS